MEDRRECSNIAAQRMQHRQAGDRRALDVRRQAQRAHVRFIESLDLFSVQSQVQLPCQQALDTEDVEGALLRQLLAPERIAACVMDGKSATRAGDRTFLSFN